MNGNKEAFESEEIIAYYKAYEGLQKPERTILGLLRPLLNDARVLDIGVGGGRTTRFLTDAREYVGIDSSAGMIKVCQEKYLGTANLRFLVCDVRDMRIFANERYDIILFSFNGIDYISHTDRLLALREIRRVCKTKGSFVFSSHNIHYAPRHFRKFQVLPIRWPPWHHILANMKRRKLNPVSRSLTARDKYAIINDGAANWKIKSTYYIDPQYQITQLRDAGFNDVHIFSLNTGLEISTEKELEENRDFWLYYLCQAF